MQGILIVVISAIVSSLIARMLLGAGLAILSFNWINDLVNDAISAMQGFLYNLPADIIGILSIIMIPQALSVVMSAYGIAAFVRTAKVFIGKAN